MTIIKMKGVGAMKKPCFILIIIFGLSIFSKSVMACEGFDAVSNKIFNIISFSESGIMVQYNTLNSIDEEINLLTKRLKNNSNNKNIKILPKEIKITRKDSYIDINVYKERNIVQTEIYITNYNKTKSMSELKKELMKLQTKNAFNIKYFKYIKGKIKNENQVNNLLNNKKVLVNVKGLNIHNGYVGDANLTNGLKVNFAKIKYNSGSYFILGNPIIYTTY